MTISSTTVKNSYNGDGSTATFTYTFKIFANSDLQVIIRSALGTETVKTLTTHYTVTGAGSASGGDITFTAGNIPASGETVVLRRAIPQTQAIDYIANDPFPAESHEEGLDRATMAIQQLQEEVDRAIKLSRTNTITSSEFTVGATNRANKVLAFDAVGELSVAQELGQFQGNWTAGETFAQRDLVKDTSNNNIYICLTAHTSSGSLPISSNADSAKWSLIVDAASATSSASAASASAADALVSENNAATSESNAATSEANAAASYDAFDDRYLGSKASDPALDNDGNALIDGALYFDTTNNVMKVYDLGGTSWRRTTPTTAEQANINTVSGISANVTTVAGNNANVSTVATNIASVNTVATNIADVIKVADDLNEAVSEVETVANDLNEAVSEIEVVANNITNVNTVGTNIANVNTVAGISANVTTVANDGTDIGTVATNIANVNTVAGNNANINTVAGNNANITTVAGISSNITTVANDTADIGTVAGSIANVNLVGGSIANVNEVANNIGTVNNFGERYRVGSTNPTTNNDEGDLFYNTTDDTFYVWTGSTWEAITDRAEALQAIATTKNDTAVDVFIYDTRKDSDGGAWRKRTQHTSWYNETLNTATRGSRKEFPAVAVIVAESDQVTIYDGDDPSLPMWMVFNDGGSTGILGWDTTVVRTQTSIIMLNGIMVGGYNTGGYAVDFIADHIKLIFNVAYSLSNSSLVSVRNDATPVTAGGDGYVLVSQFINDVAMTVLPNAPIDNATGLPVPTIAVATDGGVSVIKDDGTVVDDTAILSNNAKATNISFIDNKLAFGTRDTGVYTRVTPIPTADRSAITSNDNIFWLSSSYGITSGNDYILPTTFHTKAIETNDTVLFQGTNGSGVFLHSLDNLGSDNEIFSTHITSDHNTGWMPGDIKLATLSDTDDTSITGSELITNGTFDTDTTGWTAYNGATLSVSSGQLVIQGSGNASQQTVQSITTEVGKQYVLTYDAFAGTINSGQIKIGTSAGSFNITFDNGVTSSNNADIYFTATTTTTYISLGLNSGLASSGTFKYDNVSVREVVEDRSYKNKGLQVFGTIDKTPVATGADLVGYGSFGSSNYLYHPNSDALNFGTGDFTIAFWVKTTDGYGTIITGQTFAVAIYPFDVGYGYLSFAGAGRGYISIIDNIYHQCILTRRSGVIYNYLDGVLDSTQNNTTNYTDTEFRIGVRFDNAQGLSPCQLALLRVSHTGMTAEQVAKVYNDEKFLFQENAKATLYGTSNAVTALAYDDTTKLLHAGTSSGRSVFNGLRRVDNTTDAVGTVISASNGLVVDE